MAVIKIFLRFDALRQLSRHAGVFLSSTISTPETACQDSTGRMCSLRRIEGVNSRAMYAELDTGMQESSSCGEPASQAEQDDRAFLDSSCRTGGRRKRNTRCHRHRLCVLSKDTKDRKDIFLSFRPTLAKSSKDAYRPPLSRQVS